MNEKAFLNELEEILELDPNTLQGDETLLDIEQWDSLAFLSVIALADQKFDLVIPGDQLESIKTIPDLIDLMGEHIVKEAEPSV